MEDLEDEDGYGYQCDYDSDDSRKDAKLVATGVAWASIDGRRR